jgi:hypothetical protein
VLFRSLQVAYLDEHPQCALVHHAVEHISWPAGEPLGEHPPSRFRVQRLQPHDLARVNCIQTCSVVFRRSALPELDEQYVALKIGDWPLFVLLSQHGWIGYIDRSMAHYRIHAANGWNNRTPEYKLKAMEAMAWYLLERVNEKARNHWQNTILALAFKDAVLSAKSLSTSKFVAKLRRFVSLSARFRKPFWIVNSLWPYYRANCRPFRLRRRARYNHPDAVSEPSRAAPPEHVSSQPSTLSTPSRTPAASPKLTLSN